MGSECRGFLVVGNWMMNGDGKSLHGLIRMINKRAIKVKEAELCVAPPFIYAKEVRRKITKKVHVAAQNCFSETAGAYTGETSAEMLKDIGIDWVILGHSERRNMFCEGEKLIAAKLRHVLNIGFTVLVCVGESRDQRDSGLTYSVIISQLRTVFDNTCRNQWGNVILVYEPTWVNYGPRVRPEEIDYVHQQIRNHICSNVSERVSKCIRILYGGFIDDCNCVEFACQPNIDGFLVGPYSLRPEFVTIIQARTPVKKRKPAQKKRKKSGRKKKNKCCTECTPQPETCDDFDICDKKDNRCGRKGDICAKKQDKCGKKEDKCGKSQDKCGKSQDKCGKSQDKCGKN